MPKRPPSKYTAERALRVAEETIRAMELQADAEYCVEDLHFFLQQCWPAMHPGTPFQDSWHIGCLTEHLQALVDRQIRRLIINVPPRSLKSTIVSVAFPAWRWLKAPHEKFLAASYGLALAKRDSRRCRNLIASQWYQARWASRYGLSSDQNEKGRFDNDRGGFRMIASVEGGVLGEGGSCLTGDSRIATDIGMLPISEIVDRRMDVSVLGSGGWQNITGYSKTTGSAIVEIRDESGAVLCCTENHPIWIEHLGWVSAREVVELYYANQNLRMRHLRSSVQSELEARGKMPERTVLFEEMLRTVRDGREESGVVGRCRDSEVPELSQGNIRQARHGGEAQILLSELQGAVCMERPETKSENLPVLRGAVQAHEHGAEILLPVVCQLSASGANSREGEWQIRTRAFNESIWPRIFRDASSGGEGSGWQAVCDLREDGDPSRTSHRWIGHESRSGESSHPLYFMPSEGAYTEGSQEGMDETVRITSIRRCPPTDYVYNLEVTPGHDYYAEGILTHNCIIMDDPNDLEKMNKEPDSYPQSVRDWYSGSMSSRNIDPKTDVRLCVQQRASYGGDLTEYLLELGGWEHVVIPNEWKGVTVIGPLAYPDPRTKMGELMFPERLGPAETDTIKREQKQHYPGQYQQEPSVGGKNGLKREWFRFYNPAGMGVVDAEGKPRPVRLAIGDGTFVEIVPVELPPAFEQVVQSWDCAFKGTDESDFVAGQAWGRIGSTSYLLERDTDHRTFTETLAAMRRMAERVPCPEKLVEDKANGTAVIDTLKNEIPGLIPVTPAGGKWSRVAAISGYVEAGNVYLPNPDLFPWVWDLLAEFAAGIGAKHDDDTDAMTQALKRLYDANARAGVPEFRISPRLGEPKSAMHIMAGERIRPEWRRYAAVVPGGAALFIAETPSGGLRVTDEVGLGKVDAIATGREVARRALACLLGRPVEIRGMRAGYEVYLPKRAFAPIEAVGSWAEMMEAALLSFEPEDGDWEGRNQARQTLQGARVRTEMVEDEPEAALDRLRGLLAFAPPDFRQLPYDRRKALALAEQDLAEYHRYLGMVEGVVTGEWPKIKIAPSCTGLIAELGAFRKDVDATPFVEALLLAVCAPGRGVGLGEVRETAWPPRGRQTQRNGKLMARKFAGR